MRIFVISLLRSNERRKAVVEQFSKTTLRFRFFDAIDGNTSARRYFGRYDPVSYRLNTYREPAPGEIACFASHLALWRCAVALNEPIIVLEDDCALAATFEAGVRAAQKLIAHFGFIRLQASLRRRPLRTTNGGTLLTTLAPFRLYYLRRVPLCLTGYAICPRTAMRLVAASDTLGAPVDKFVQQTWQHRVPIFGLEPACVAVSSLGALSTIGDRTRHRRDLRSILQRARYKLAASWRRRRFNQSQLEILHDYLRARPIPQPAEPQSRRLRNSVVRADSRFPLQ